MQGHICSQPQNAAMIVASLHDCVIAAYTGVSKRLQVNAKRTELGLDRWLSSARWIPR